MHVVLLGAGASRAALPQGDKNQKFSPLMNDFVETLGLRQVLTENGIDPSSNFEEIYPELNATVQKNIEQKINEYFRSLTLPDTATHYDRLLLSLRKNDAIFTFNWDPYLCDAYKRNRHLATLPKIFYLHGNVRVASCTSCNNWGEPGNRCRRCKKEYIDVPLLYPIRNKDYFTSNDYTKRSWEDAQSCFSGAFTITIFGYSAPTSDTEAVSLLHKAWLSKSDRKFEHVEVIDIESKETIYDRWKIFTPTHHLHHETTFEKSRICRWPRRSCEALYYPMTKAEACEEFPLTQTNDLAELQDAIKGIAKYET